MKKKIFLSMLVVTALEITAASSVSAADLARQRRASTANQIQTSRRQRAANTTPGRRAEGFSNNPLLNWRHPYQR